MREFLGLCAAFPVLVLALPYVCLLLGAHWLVRIIFRAGVSVINDRRAVHGHYATILKSTKGATTMGIIADQLKADLDKMRARQEAEAIRRQYQMDKLLSMIEELKELNAEIEELEEQA